MRDDERFRVRHGWRAGDRVRLLVLVLAGFGSLFGAACSRGTAGPADQPPTTSADTVRIALSDLGPRTYRRFQGGLYENGSNAVPSDHAALGLQSAGQIRPLDGSGAPAANGKIVLLSIGMSNTTQEFCQPNAQGACQAWTFGGQAANDPAVNKVTLAIVDGASGGQAASTWDDPADANYNRVRDTRLGPRGLTERQVQIAWLKVANPGPTVALPDERADAYTLLTQMGSIVRALKQRYPNLRQVFASSRIYAGYATTTLNPEPYAYESGFAVQWLIAAQIEQDRRGTVNARAGDLHFPSVAPWLAWGPYLWADGMNARSDGLTWARIELAADGTHPSQAGQQKVGTLLLAFFKTSPFTRCWFLAGQSC
jgi:hypothetical protein